jgi:uncharacterized phage infection (PIP) family protein YhgE
MRLPSSRLVVSLVAVAIGVSACSSGGGSATSDATATSAASEAATTSVVPKRPASDPLCVAAKQIFDIDATYSSSFAAAIQDATSSTDPGAFTAAMQKLKSEGEFDSLLQAYDDLATAVPEADKAQVATLRDYTSRLFDQVVAMPSVAELKNYIDSLQSSPDTITAGKAALALDNLTYSECGQHMSSG